jgi:leader peptidase (prepilin peptidase)/N-methyltransferase
MGDILEVLVLYPTFAYLGALVLGLLVGSFLNVVIYRLPKMMEAEWREQCAELLCDSESVQDPAQAPAADKPAPFNLVVPRSRCPHCGHQIAAWENIPVISYLFLRGKCSACKAPISPRYPIIELVTGLLSLFVIYSFGATTLGLMVLIFTWCLIALTMIDIDTFLLPDQITLPLLWLGLIVNSFGLHTNLHDALWGAAAGYLILWSIYWSFKLLTGKEGMGYGDFKLLAALGAWMGWQYLPQIILLSALVGVVIGVALMFIKKRGKDIPIPFGPYLAIAGWVAFMWGDHINQQYLKLFVVSY